VKFALLLRGQGGPMVALEEIIFRGAKLLQLAFGAHTDFQSRRAARYSPVGILQPMKATPFNLKTIDEFHAKKGLGVGMWGDHVLLMTAKGAKTGEPITTPLVYGREGDDYILVASKGGAPKHPAWFENVKATPEVEVEVASGGETERFKARAHMVDSRAERDRLYKEMSKIWPSFLEYEKRTERLIPIVILKRLR
jgi:deazaflavin-dependent oxidoreductase (nitroreductase family)